MSRKLKVAAAGWTAFVLMIWTFVLLALDAGNDFRIPVYVVVPLTAVPFAPMCMLARYALRYGKPGSYEVGLIGDRIVSRVGGIQSEIVGPSKLEPLEQDVLDLQEQYLTGLDPMLACKLALIEPLDIVMKVASWWARLARKHAWVRQLDGHFRMWWKALPWPYATWRALLRRTWRRNHGTTHSAR